MPRKTPQPDKQSLLFRLGSLLRDTRQRAGLYQEHLGARAGIAGSRVGEIERGGVNTSILRIDQLVTALGIPLWRLFRQLDLDDPEALRLCRKRLLLILPRLTPIDIDLLAELAERLAGKEPAGAPVRAT